MTRSEAIRGGIRMSTDACCPDTQFWTKAMVQRDDAVMDFKPLRGTFSSPRDAVEAADYISGRFASLTEAVNVCRDGEILFLIGQRGVEDVRRVCQ